MSSAIAAVADAVLSSTIAACMQNPWWLPMLVATISYFKSDQEGQPKDIEESRLLSEYDFIIVGAGSAGSVVANRLSEIGNWNILLLEAGGYETVISDVPLLAGYLQNSEMDWAYKTEPSDKFCLASNERKCSWPRGKVLGGSSVLNFMVYVRGNKRDYDIWESLGNKGWGYKDILYYFKKSEDNLNPNLAKNPYHGIGGYLTVTEAPYHTALTSAFIEGGQELGYESRDINGDKQTGFMVAQGTTRRGSRCSAAKAFLRPAKDRQNLHVSIKSYVTKVLIDPKTNVAFGVEFVKNNAVYRVRAKKEVILSAGSINSPQLLMLSGVGPSQELTKHRIPVIQDLQGVGQNLQDHVALGGLFFTISRNRSALDDRIPKIEAEMIYAAMEDGPLTAIGGNEGVAFVNTKYANASDDFPDVEFHFKSVPTGFDGGEQNCKTQGINDEFCESVFSPLQNKTTFAMLPMLLRPRSKGYIKLRSADPFEYPAIYPNYFADEMDMQVLVEGVKVAFSLVRTKAFQKFGVMMNPNVFPACKAIPRYCNEFWECMIRQYTATVYHLIGTAKMGPSWDCESVVDDQLKVYGVKGLRVIDGSIMPVQVSGNTNAPIIMIGEKGSDMIKECWLKEKTSLLSSELVHKQVHL